MDMNWIAIIVGTLILVFEIVVFMVGVEKGKRWDYIKKDIVITIPIVIKALTVIMGVSVIFYFLADGALSIVDNFIAITLLVLIYSVGKEMLEIIIYTVKFLLGKNKEGK